MKKKIISMLLAVVMLLSVAPVAVFAEDTVSGTCGVDGENIVWTINAKNGILTISGTGYMRDYTAGQAPWYENRSLITKVIIENGVENIGECAFSNLAAEVIDIPDSVKSIGKKAFQGSSVKSLNFNEYVVIDMYQTFFNCQNLQNVNIPAATTSINDYSFWNCISLKELIIPETVTEISGAEIFDRCNAKITVKNADCIFDMSSPYIFSPTSTVYSYKNSTAETYCNKYGYTFVIIEMEETTVVPDTETTLPSDENTTVDNDDLQDNCNCICHKDGFMELLYSFVRFFWKLFSINNVCSCGVAHY